MKRWVAFFFYLVACVFAAKADHITGGVLSYHYTGVTDGKYQYSATLKLYMRCNSGREFNNPTIISVFENQTNTRVQDINVRLTRFETIQLTEPDPCISNPPVVCYVVGYYDFTLSLPAANLGYTVVGQVNFRINTISNLQSGYDQVGATYTSIIPGSAVGTDAPKNSSANFTGTDLVVVCANNAMSYSFAASDDDGDQLRYSFCDAYNSSTRNEGGGGGGGGNNATAALNPPYRTLPYNTNLFTGSSPLGSKVSIDENTGLISGIAPAAGIYVITVCVQEIRNGVVIATQRKDLQVNIAACTLVSAALQPEYLLCQTSKTISLTNLSQSTLVKSYYWEIRSQRGILVFTSTNPAVSYSFTDTGTYSIKLVVNREEACTDSALSVARVYPGFVPAFATKGFCLGKPTNFTDASTSVYGVANNWVWDFGEATTNSDTSKQKNTSYTYPMLGNKTVTLIVADSKGCRDTVTKSITIFEKPPLELAFRDTLICIPDKLKLIATNDGNYSWTPNINITNANTATPTVSPTTTTVYHVLLTDDNCTNTDSVKVRVTDKVLLLPMGDTTICQGDAITLHTASNALHYTWTPPAGLNDSNAASPIATATATITYQVLATIGSCAANTHVTINPVPYPTASAGPDTTICHGTTAYLHGTAGGGSYTWAPSSGLAGVNSIANQFTTPLTATSAYVFTVYDNKGCPKPGIDTLLITVLPAVAATAGHDTVAVLQQPLQLHAAGGISYTWLPAANLSNSHSPEPVAVFYSAVPDIDYMLIAYNAAGCSDTAYIKIKIFSTPPSIFVPTAFTPNGDGKNETLRPIPVGIKYIEYFKVFNRWGQLVFSTNQSEMGWDGSLNGQMQASSQYVWMVKATDYTGKTYQQKGTVLLIR